MNNVNINELSFQSTESYKKFIEDNPGKGNLMIRASSAKEAIPLPNVDITVSKTIDNYNVIFFQGKTDNSGMINNLSLPAPKSNNNDLITPQSTTYLITATTNNKKQTYTINMYNNICVVQTINIIPEMNEEINNYGN